MEHESSWIDISITSNKRLDFGSPTLRFLPNSREILPYFPLNLFLQLLNKITIKIYEGIEDWKCLKTIPPIRSAIEELQSKFKN